MNLLPPAVCSTGEQRLLLNAIDWRTYVAIGDALLDHPGLYMTYDRGSLELMTHSRAHEVFKMYLGRLVETLAEEMNLSIAPGGNMTFRREDFGRGLEPDQCYWIANEARVRSHLEWNPERDPPPDLVLEVELSRSALDRMDIYATLGVPEVWRFDGERLHVHLLRSGPTYEEASASPTFPAIDVARIVSFIPLSEDVGYLGMVRAFRTWAREQLARPGN